ncbi:hypothetical protein ACN4EG_00050 [Alkalinema pantanalense CENA528]|uniref:hypothetical protein n=1 Tax=Alkalinema pantanalense TaxID=1620705 RepID=UPI003D6E75CE
MFIGFDEVDRVINDDRQPLQFYLLGSRREVQAAIDQLHVLRFSDRVLWSRPVPVPRSEWKYVSRMQRQQPTDSIG